MGNAGDEDSKRSSRAGAAGGREAGFERDRRCICARDDRSAAVADLQLVAQRRRAAPAGRRAAVLLDRHADADRASALSRLRPRGRRHRDAARRDRPQHDRQPRREPVESRPEPAQAPARRHPAAARHPRRRGARDRRSSQSDPCRGRRAEHPLSRDTRLSAELQRPGDGTPDRRAPCRGDAGRGLSAIAEPGPGHPGKPGREDLCRLAVHHLHVPSAGDAASGRHRRVRRPSTACRGRRRLCTSSAGRPAIPTSWTR